MTTRILTKSISFLLPRVSSALSPRFHLHLAYDYLDYTANAAPPPPCTCYQPRPYIVIHGDTFHFGMHSYIIITRFAEDIEAEAQERWLATYV